jgi:hypothetical protein
MYYELSGIKIFLEKSLQYLDKDNEKIDRQTDRDNKKTRIWFLLKKIELHCAEPIHANTFVHFLTFFETFFNIKIFLTER